MLGLPLTEVLGVDRRGERAPRGEIGEEDSLVGREHRGGLGHEVHAAEDDDVGFRLGGFAGEPERVADEVRDILHFGALVVVRQDDGVPLAREGLDLSLQLRDELFARDDSRIGRSHGRHKLIGDARTRERRRPRREAPCGM